MSSASAPSSAPASAPSSAPSSTVTVSASVVVKDEVKSVSFGKFPDWVVRASPINGIDYRLLSTVETTIYSSLLPHHVSGTVTAFRKFGVSTGRIVDATAHVGCDTLNLERMYPRAEIIAIEEDPCTFKCLVQNLASCQSRVTAVNADCTQYLRKNDIPKDITLVYFDPPWGGSDYFHQKSLDLFLGGKPISDIVRHTLEKVAPLVVLKVPTNFNMSGFLADLQIVLMSVHPITKPFGKKKGEVIYSLLEIRRINQWPRNVR